MFRRFWVTVVLMAVAPWIAAASLGPEMRSSASHTPLNVRELGIWNAASREAQFAMVPHVSYRGSCEVSAEPEALATPNPLLEAPKPKTRVTVSFIIGADGRVYSPLILESAGSSEDRTVLDAVRSWRYRPALCNGVPTEAEGKIEFSIR
jgi:TonB family protein